MQLINTIELDPFQFAEREYDSPGVSMKESPELWDQYWKKSISDKNLGRLEAIEKGSWLVDIQSINDDELEEIIKDELTEAELADFEEQVGKIYGGIVLRENNKILIEPSCCGDLGNLMEWERIFESGFDTWIQLWIGHPWVFYRRDNAVVGFSDYTDFNLEDFKDIEIRISVSESDLQMQLKEIRKQQKDFEHRIRKVLDKMGIANAERIAKLLTGNM